MSSLLPPRPPLPTPPSPRLVKVFVSGCYDLLHAGHIQFFTEARSLAYTLAPSNPLSETSIKPHLTVSFASSEVLWIHKSRLPSIPDDHKAFIISSLSMVDEVVVGTGGKEGLDFEAWFLLNKPDLLVVTEDDKYGTLKRSLCSRVGARYVVLPKTPPPFTPVSTTALLGGIRAPQWTPLRVDFGGGWLDVPRHAIEGAVVVNLAVTPGVSSRDWGKYRIKSGMGGSAANSILKGEDGVKSEVEELGVGWQDPAVIKEVSWMGVVGEWGVNVSA